MTGDELLSEAMALGSPGEGARLLGRGGLYLYTASWPSQPEHRVYEPAFGLILQGAKSVRADGASLTFQAGQSLLIGTDLAVLTRVVEASPARPYALLGVRPDMALLRELAAGEPASSDPVIGAAPFAAQAADAQVLAAMGRLLRLAREPRAERALAPLALREVHWWMLEGPHGALLRRLVSADGPASRIAGITAAIRADPARPLRVPDLARDAGMSPSAFHAHFRRLTATTPLQFQKRLRLIEARARLRAGSGVGEAAFAVGYESPTQFSRDYRRAFGTAPREDRAEPLAAE